MSCLYGIANRWIEKLLRHLSASPKSVGNIQAGGNVNVTQQNINVPLEQIDKLLKERNGRHLAKLPQADPQEKQTLLKEKAALEAKYKIWPRPRKKLRRNWRKPPRPWKICKQEFSPGRDRGGQGGLKPRADQGSEQLFQAAFTKGRQLAEKGQTAAGRSRL